MLLFRWILIELSLIDKGWLYCGMKITQDIFRLGGVLREDVASFVGQSSET